MVSSLPDTYPDSPYHISDQPSDEHGISFYVTYSTDDPFLQVVNAYWWADMHFPFDISPKENIARC